MRFSIPQRARRRTLFTPRLELNSLKKFIQPPTYFKVLFCNMLFVCLGMKWGCKTIFLSSFYFALFFYFYKPKACSIFSNRPFNPSFSSSKSSIIFCCSMVCKNNSSIFSKDCLASAGISTNSFPSLSF